MNKGFTLIELVVTIAIIGVLSGVTLFSVSQYINKGKDSNLFGNLNILVPAGETYYNGNGGNYQDFCDPTKPSGSVFKNAISQMPQNPSGNCYGGDYTANSNPQGVCCAVAPSTQNYQAWAACAREFADSSKAYCVDSRGMKEHICCKNCTNGLTQCPDTAQTGCLSSCQ